MIEKLEIPPETVPSIADQAAALGWNFGIHNFGKAEERGVDFFNSGLVERPDGLWLLVRRADMNVMNGFGLNNIIALKLDETGTMPLHGKVLEWPGALPGQQFEDPRAVYVPHMNQVAVSACTFQWYGEGSDPAWSGAIQVLGFFDQDWKCKILHYPPFDTNGTELKVVPREAYQKNWLWWHRNGRLHLLYKSEPWTVVTFDSHWIDRRMVHVGSPLTWPYGTIRGGTPPIELDGMLVTFFHSSTPWYDRWRRYHMGAIGFNPEPPFQPLRMTMEPLISGTTATHWGPRKPACIFPCGAVKRGDRLLVTAGVNDLRSCWFDMPVESVLSRMVPINQAKPKGGDAISNRNELPRQSQSLAPDTSNAAPTSEPEGAAVVARKRAPKLAITEGWKDPEAGKFQCPEAEAAHEKFIREGFAKAVAEVKADAKARKRGKRMKQKPKRTAAEQAKINARMAKVRAARKTLA